MKCPRCNGNGSVPYHIADDLFDETNCPLCGGSGEVITEQEYIQTCNTEQLAEAIYYLTWFHTELDERLDKNVKNGCYNDDENIKIVMEWLKQLHREE